MKEQNKFSFNKRKEKLFAKRSSPRVSPLESRRPCGLVFQLAVFRHMGFYMNNNLFPLLIDHNRLTFFKAKDRCIGINRDVY